MNGKKARVIRKKVCCDTALRNTKYFKDPNTGQIISDKVRRAYQNAKHSGCQ